jgi:hypothetical protein
MTDLPVMTHSGKLLDARLHLLDRQLVDDNDDPLGVVDDLELSGVEPDRDIATGSPAPQVTELLTGRAMLTRILGGGPPRSLLQEIPWSLIECVGVVVKLQSKDLRLDSNWVERWLCDHIITHVPGGRHAAE